MMNIMEKYKPHHDLNRFKRAVATKDITFTQKAIDSYQTLNLHLEDVL